MKEVKKFVYLSGIILLLTSFITQYSHANTGDTTFADWLFKNGYYDIARYELLSMIYKNDPEWSDLSSQLYVNIAQCYLLSEKYGEGIKWCQYLEKTLSEGVLSEIHIIHAILLMKMKFYDESISVLSNNDFVNVDLRNRADFLLGCSNAYKWDLNNCISYWSKISTDHTLRSLASDYMQFTKEAKSIKFLNPSKGAFLGIIPGLGYLYAGHKQTALASFIVIGLTTWGTYASFRENINGIGYLTGLLSIGWYSGSIYGSYWAVKRRNDYHREQYLNKIQF